MGMASNRGSEANQSRKKRGAIEVEEVDQAKTRKKQKLDRGLFLCSLCFKLLRSTREDWFGWRFEELAVENPDYFSVISKPMDFVTIKSKLAKNLYANIVKEFPEDVRLVFANAMRYYPPENSVHKNAKKLKGTFEFRWESVKKNLACEYAEMEVDYEKQSRPKTSSCSGTFYLVQKVSLSTNPVKEQSKKVNPEDKLDQDLKGFAKTVPLSLRAATIRIRFADTIVKAKYRKLLDEGSDKADVMMRIQKEKQLLERRQRAEKARIEAEIRAVRLKELRKERLAIEKSEEEAMFSIEDPLKTEEEILNLCGGSYMASIRWVKKLGLFLRIEDYWPNWKRLRRNERSSRVSKKQVTKTICTRMILHLRPPTFSRIPWPIALAVWFLVLQVSLQLTRFYWFLLCLTFVTMFILVV